MKPFNLLLYWQPEIPRPDNTKPGEEWGLYSVQDFFMANWYYITAVVLLALIVLYAARQKKKTHRKKNGELKN